MNKRTKIYYLDREKIELEYKTLKEFSIDKNVPYSIVFKMLYKGVMKRSTLNKYPTLDGYFIEMDR